MRSFSYLIECWTIGFAIAAILGPIGILCIRKTLELGFIGGLSVGIGAALADGAYGFIAGTGITIISEFLLEKSILIKIIGSIFLCYLGIKELKNSSPSHLDVFSRRKKFFGLASQTFFLTLANPLTILSFIAIFASIGGRTITLEESIWIVIGIFLGSMTWWIFLSKFVAISKKYISELWIHWIRYASAFILISFGAWAVLSSILSLINLKS